jgi:phytoene synthase
MTDLSQPFYTEWPWGRRPAAQAFWHWHSALVEPTVPRGTSADTFFDQERARTEAGESLRLVGEEVYAAAYEACSTHDLSRKLLGAQVEAARVLRGETRFESADELETFVRLWALPHARLLAGLADLTNSVQIGWVDELARGFFHFAHLVSLPQDLGQDRLFVPLEDLRQAGVSVDQLREGRVDESVRRLLWKQGVRVRDALAQGRSLANDLGFRQRYALKRYWLGMLALLNELERREYDLWSEPLELSLFRRVQVYLQIVFGRLRL